MPPSTFLPFDDERIKKTQFKECLIFRQVLLFYNQFIIDSKVDLLYDYYRNWVFKFINLVFDSTGTEISWAEFNLAEEFFECVWPFCGVGA